MDSIWVEHMNSYSSGKSLLAVSWKQGLGMLAFIRASKNKNYARVVQISNCSESEARRIANMGDSAFWQWFNSVKKDPGMGIGIIARGSYFEKIEEIVQRIV